MNPKVAYIFGGGRKARWQEALRGSLPQDFFFGATGLARMGWDVHLFEPEDALGKSHFCHVFESQLGSYLGAGARIPIVARLLPKISSSQWIIGTPDSVGLALGRLKLRGQINGRCAGFIMGLGAKIDDLKSKILRYLALLYYGSLLQGLDAILCLGEGEKEFLSAHFPLHAHKMHFLPFGVDVSFWCSPKPIPISKKPKDYILFVGNDPSRDYQMVQQIINILPKQKIIVVSKIFVPDGSREYIRHIGGDWGEQILSDHEMRKLYQDAMAVILPLRDTWQPTGQSVCLQAMACAAPVLITRNKGLWEPHHFRDGQNCFLMPPDASVDIWKQKLEWIVKNTLLASKIGEQARWTVEKYWNSDLFADRLNRILLGHGTAQ